MELYLEVLPNNNSWSTGAGVCTKAQEHVLHSVGAPCISRSLSRASGCVSVQLLCVLLKAKDTDAVCEAKHTAVKHTVLSILKHCWRSDGTEWLLKISAKDEVS